MTIKQKAFQVLSFLAIVGGVDLSITARVLFTSGQMTFEPLHLLTIALSVIFSVLVGILGLRAAGDPLKVSKLFFVTMLALWANFCNVFLFFLNDHLIVSPVINLLIVIALVYMANQVKREPR